MPSTVKIGEGFYVAHGMQGCVIHSKTIIGDHVKIFHQVTIGRADAGAWDSETNFSHVEIGDDVLLGAGAKILGGPGVTRVGNGTIVGANAVLLTSTGDNEIWAGVPARRVGKRNTPTFAERQTALGNTLKK
jgi:serine O-acetyltransferase